MDCCHETVFCQRSQLKPQQGAGMVQGIEMVQQPEMKWGRGGGDEVEGSREQG